MDAVIEALRDAIPDEVKTLSRVLVEAGLRSWVVGGSVRDVVLALRDGQEVRVDGDWDLATDARPEQIQQLFRKVIPTGLQHGTVTVVLNKQHFELTTLRGERGHSDGRRPDEVFFVDDLEADLARRDFTVNAMAYSVSDGTFHDPYGGAQDLKAGLLRAVGEPAQRFAEDGLRVLRCARFCATLGLTIEERTQEAIVPSLASFKKVAQERVCDEWFKALRSSSPSRFLQAIFQHKMLEITAPMLWSDGGSLIPFEEALRKVDQAPQDALLRLALFVRAGCSSSADPGKTARTLASHLRLSRDERERLTTLCAHAVLPPELHRHAGGYAGRKWLAQVTRLAATDVLTMQAQLDASGIPNNNLAQRQEELRAELDSRVPLTLKELAITGGDLIKEGGFSKGPELGRALGSLLEEVLQDPAKNERATLLHLAKELR